MAKTLHFHFYDAGAYDGETEHRIMCNFYSITDGEIRIGQSQLVLASGWPKYRGHLEQGGWTHRECKLSGAWYEGNKLADANKAQAAALRGHVATEPQDIVVTEDMYAPRSDYYVATFGDFDLDCLTGRGHTPLDAIVDLLDKAE